MEQVPNRQRRFGPEPPGEDVERTTASANRQLLDRVARHLDTAAMQLINEHTAEAYLRQNNLLAPDEEVLVRELPGGVSNVVLYVTRPIEPDFVVKQAREQLRVAAPWFCSVERIWREVETMQVCTELLTDSSTGPPIPTATPDLLFSDNDNFLYGMSAVGNHETWKQQLLRGEVCEDVARSCGWLMGRLHGGTWGGRLLPNSLHDRQFFDALRVDPYYREIARVHAELTPAIDRLINSLASSICCLVHGDFSPKNLLVHAQGLVLIDFEVGHFGDPAFDIGFFLSHLALKAFRAGDDSSKYLTLIAVFREAYADEFCRLTSEPELLPVEQRAAANLAACLLARIDGKSQVDYLTEPTRTLVRNITRAMLLNSAASLDDVIHQIHSTLQKNHKL
ncbi:MAG: phosphotransferase [Planctomycetota bacterium]|nr:phosphotransferase [Planctomycetota bacterium]